jgi:predicted GH43/DUF377 family glycosyl hydrolase
MPKRSPTPPASLALLLTFSLAACGPAATVTSGPASAAAATPVPTTTPTTVPTPTAAAAVTKLFTFDTGVVVDTTIAGTGDLYINPGAVIEADGALHMFANSFSEWPGRMLVPHLTSEDGSTWTLDEQAPPIDSNDVELADPGIDVSTGYLAADGTWTLFYTTISTTEAWVVARATAPGPRGPWAIEDTPILTAGAAGAFDAGGIQWPSVAKVGDRWAMYYAGIDAVGSRKGAIGVAFSDDGVTWTKHDGPVLMATEPWELGSLDRPRVVATPGGLVMLYAGLDLNSRGLATSTDGMAWTRIPGPSVVQSAFPIAGGGWDSALLYRDGLLEYFLEIGPKTTAIFRATLPWP